MNPIVLVVATLGLILLNAIFVAAEFAIVRVRRTRLEELAGQGVEAAKSAIVVVDSISDYLALTQIGVTIASLAVGWLAEETVMQLLRVVHSGDGTAGGALHAAATVVAFVFVTTLHVVFGEQVPKLLAVRSAEHYLMALAGPLHLVHFLLKPVLRVLERLSSGVLRCMGHGVATNAPLSEDELKLILADSHRGGIITDGEAEIIIHAFDFADRQAEAVMIPAERVTYLSLAQSLEHNLAVASEHAHARLPLCHDGLDSVIGTVSVKDVWPLLEQQRSNAVFEQVRRAPVFIAIDASQEDILMALRRAHAHIGIVRDRANLRTVGIVTLEDVLESLLGDVREGKLAWARPEKP